MHSHANLMSIQGSCFSLHPWSCIHIEPSPKSPISPALSVFMMPIESLTPSSCFLYTAAQSCPFSSLLAPHSASILDYISTSSIPQLHFHIIAFLFYLCQSPSLLWTSLLPCLSYLSVHLPQCTWLPHINFSSHACQFFSLSTSSDLKLSSVTTCSW